MLYSTCLRSLSISFFSTTLLRRLPRLLARIRNSCHFVRNSLTIGENRQCERKGMKEISISIVIEVSIQ